MSSHAFLQALDLLETYYIALMCRHALGRIAWQAWPKIVRQQQGLPARWDKEANAVVSDRYVDLSAVFRANQMHLTVRLLYFLPSDNDTGFR